ENRIRTDGVCRRLCESSQKHAVVKRAGRFLGELPQKRLIEIRELQKCEVGRDPENALEENEKAVSEYGRENRICHRVGERGQDRIEIFVSLERKGDDGQRVSEKDEHEGPEDLRPVADVPYGVRAERAGEERSQGY